MKLFLMLTAVLLFVSLSTAQEKQKSCDNKMKCENKQNCEMKQKKAETTLNKKVVVVNKVCPVSGEELENVNVTFTYKGKTYGFCCEKCLTKVKANPEKYLANLNDDGTFKKQ